MNPSATQANTQSANPGEKKKLHGAYYRVMVNLPIIIKEKEIIDRKLTIDVFKRKSASNQKQPSHQKLTQNKKSADDQIGRIYINELWSDKFHKLVMNESKIQEVLEKIQKLYRRNVEDFVDDIHKATIDKANVSETIISKHINACSVPYFAKSNSQLDQDMNLADTILDDYEDQSFMMSSNKMGSSDVPAGNPPKKNSVNLLLKTRDSELDSLEKFVKHKYMRKQKDNFLSKPRHTPFESTINPTLFQSAQNILSQCKQINDDWEISRSMQISNAPFYTSKDDRY